MPYLREAVVTYRRGEATKPLGRAVLGPLEIREAFDFLVDRTREHLIVVYLDAKLRIVGYETAAVGAGNRVSVALPDLLRGAIVAGADRVVLLHNHPSGDETPSADDIALTKGAWRVFRSVGIVLVDHIVLGHGGASSLATMGLMPKGEEG